MREGMRIRIAGLGLRTPTSVEMRESASILRLGSVRRNG